MDIQERIARLWATIDDYGPEEFRDKMNEVLAELPEDSALAAYERGSAWDSTGHSDRAVPLYRRALELGLGEERRRQAIVQLASSLRNLGEAQESAELLRAEQARRSDELDDAVAAFLALALADSGREREGLSVALTALSGHMTRYSRSLANYASAL